MPELKLATKDDVAKKGDTLRYDAPSSSIVLESDGKQISSAKLPSKIIYGFHVNANEANPDSRVTYLENAVGMEPAAMNFATGVFNWGSWKNAFFMPRPCMVRYDGTVDYYLNPDDYTKKENGAESDIRNSNYAGNAMMEWGRDGKLIWYKVVSDASGYDVYISDSQVDDTYHAWNFINHQGAYVQHFYTPIYEGSLINGKLRSMSNQTIMVSKTAEEEVLYAKANGDCWYTETFADILLVQHLVTLITKSHNSQGKIGKGNCSSEEKLQTGTMDGRGMFWGTDGTASGVKVFGMENFWGNVWMRIAGLIMDTGKWKYKLTYGMQDGSTVNGYNYTGAGYLARGYSAPAGTPDANGYYNGYLKSMRATPDGALLPSELGGSDSTYYTDYYWNNVTGQRYALFGGRWDNGLYCGAFYWDLNNPASNTNITVGAAPSCRPLV